MAKQHAYRDLKICSKDCLCLFVCPTGASNNETGQIDFEKCIGCGACALACPAKAISMIPNKMPPQQKKEPAVIHELNMVIKQKVEAVRHFKSIMEKATTEEEKHLYQAFIHANKVMAEDLCRVHSQAGIGQCLYPDIRLPEYAETYHSIFCGLLCFVPII